MPTDEQFLQLVAELAKERRGKPDYLGWVALAVAMLGAVFSFWANNAIMGERVERLRVDFDSLSKTQTAMHDSAIMEVRNTERAAAELARRLDQRINDLHNLSRKP